MRIRITAAIIAAAFAGQAAAAEPKLLADMFGDHMVIQRDVPTAIWGEAAPGSTVTVHIADGDVTATADGGGRWQATLPTLKSGAAYELTATSSAGAHQTVGDILAGDVFLCSGQSNMQVDVSRSSYGAADVAASANPRLRMLTVPLRDALTPQDHFGGEAAWQVAGPDTVGKWSATCYFFARELQKSVDVPIGLVQASWGGSGVRTWISDEGIAAIGGYDRPLDALKAYRHDPARAALGLGDDFAAWWAAHGGEGTPWAVGGKMRMTWDKVADVSQRWEDWGVPDLAAYDGALWYAAAVKVTAKQAKQTAKLELGQVDEIDQTWVNGRSVGATGGAGVQRVYPVTAGLLKAGDNVVVVNAVDTWSKGGMYGATPRRLVFADGSTAELSDWRFKRVAAGVRLPPRAPWDNLGGLTLLYNGMIAPVGHFGLKGAVWYQGESNTFDGIDVYQASLGALMRDWRTKTGQDLPFLIVQLPEFGGPASAPGYSDWAELREGQRRAVKADGHAALAVTLGGGDWVDLHPVNKRLVGARLAQAARGLVYGQGVAPSGPEVAVVRMDGASVRVEFGGVDGALVSYSGFPTGFELCDVAGACHYAAQARIDGTAVVLTDPSAASAVKVRYGWSNSPVLNLYDAGGRPAGPFEMAVSR